MHSKYQIVTLIFTLCLVERLQGQFSPCQKCKNGPAPLECSIEGCTSKPCRVVRGTTVIGHVLAKIPFNATTLPTTAIIRLASGLFPIQVMVIREEGCNYLPAEKRCPVHAGDTIQAVIPYEMKKSWPLVTVNAEVTVEDGQGNVIACTILPLQLVNG